MNILYIEDDLVDQLSFKRAVRKKENIQYSIAGCLKDALKLLEENQFDVVLSDYYLASETVEDVLANIKDLPVFLVSGLEDVKQIKALYPLGLLGHFLKPFSADDLNTLLNGGEKNGQSVTKHLEADFSQPPKFDFAHLEEIANNDPSLKKEFIQIFLLVSEKEIENLSDSLERKQWEEIGRSAHKLKSNFRITGLHQLLLRAEEIEASCLYENGKDCSNTAILSFIQRLKQAVELSEKELLSLEKELLSVVKR